MPSLHELQSHFVRGLHGETSALDAWVCESEFTAAERLGIYRNNFRLSLRDALGGVYPVVRKLVGEGFFAFAADTFVPQHPSRSANLHDFGAAFPNFLGALPQASEVVYLPDVARLEWAWHQAFHAANTDSVDLSLLAEVPGHAHGLVRFAPAYGLCLIASRWPISRIWEAHQGDGEPQTEIELNSGDERVAVHRRYDEVLVRRLPVADFVMLQALSSGAPLEAACELVVSAVADADVGAVLARVCTSGALGAPIVP